MNARPNAWLRQAEDDLTLARLVRDHQFHAQACYLASQAAEKALKGAMLELGLEPPHTHVLDQLVRLLAELDLDVRPLADLPLKRLSRMHVSSRYPLDDTPPSELFDPADSELAIGTAEAVLRWIEQLDDPLT